MIDTILSNIGNLVCTLDYRRQKDNFARLCPGLGRARIGKAIHGHLGCERRRRFEKGAMDPATYKLEVESELGVRPLKDDEFWEAYVVLEPCLPVIEACRLIKERHPGMRLTAYGVADPVTFSCQCRMSRLPFDVMIPSFGARTEHLEELGVHALKSACSVPRRCLVLDSDRIFLAHAERLGYRVHRYSTPIMLVRTLAALDLL